MTYLFCALVAYLLGSFPTALLVVKIVAGIDVRSGASGNMGAMNTLRMVTKTKGKLAGVSSFLIVWLIDCAKAIIALYVAQRLLPDSIMAQTIATAGVILGHNYPIWLKGKGGRGAASFMGILMYYRFTLLSVWLGIVFLGSVMTDLLVRLGRHQPISGKIILSAISDQIAGRLIGEVIAVPVVAVLEPKLLWPTIVATILIVWRHKERLQKQLHLPPNQH